MTRPQSLGQESRKRGRVACVTCRQAKVRCNLITIPCSRCRRLEIDCTINSAYKRTNKRDKVNELEDDVQMLRSIVENQQAAGKLTTFSRHSDSRNDTFSSGQDLHNHACASFANSSSRELVARSSLEYVFNDRTLSLGKAALSSDDADKLFAIYFEQYHQHLPILDPSKTATEYHDLSSILFWCIISVGLRSYKQGTPLLDDLSNALSTHIWAEIGSAQKNVVGGKCTPCDIWHS